VPVDAHEKLFALPEDAEVTVDLAAQTLTLPDGTAIQFPVDGFSKTCLLEGVDELGWILKRADRITAYEQAHV